MCRQLYGYRFIGMSSGRDPDAGRCIATVDQSSPTLPAAHRREDGAHPPGARDRVALHEKTRRSADYGPAGIDASVVGCAGDVEPELPHLLRQHCRVALPIE